MRTGMLVRSGCPRRRICSPKDGQGSCRLDRSFELTIPAGGPPSKSPCPILLWTREDPWRTVGSYGFFASSKKGRYRANIVEDVPEGGGRGGFLPRYMPGYCRAITNWSSWVPSYHDADRRSKSTPRSRITQLKPLQTRF